MTRVLIIGSGPNAVQARPWSRDAFDVIVTINNAWRVRDDWDVLIHPSDFPADRMPPVLSGAQRIVTADDYVPVQNDYGGFVYAGGTMAFTAGYWALGALRPSVMAFIGCDMVYPAAGATHFYGTGTADPLRADVTLRSLFAKSARLQALAAAQGCACVNLSADDSRLVFPRATPDTLPTTGATPDAARMAAAQAEEARLAYYVPSGKYWKEEARFDPAAIDALDALWLATA
ncbi:hypothetical protein SAMN04488003_10776 [Loktanella fryxellensis]|uniref:Uncharacterized protein n=1 Tax=Loktanella fryxellensis TaxID=245187 RepID=A0A1H8CR23_9RHOB|nr:hypothetical protein [Loktanella fryxellensis]SEM97460.1 hypothetical protein SAMN04488003_10776 [Loktanella fryxellensis]